MKLGLGTANFGTNYGANNKSKFFKKLTIKKILNISRNKKIDLIDTSENYIGSHKKILKQDLKKFKIITKVSISKKRNFIKDLEKKILNLNQKFQDNLHAILIHNYEELNKKKLIKCFEVFENAKKNKLLKKFGISIYNPLKLKIIWKKARPDIIQSPLNIFDQRIVKTGWLKKIYKSSTELHVRSCFLQGTLLKKKIPNYLKNKKKHFNKWFEWCDSNKLNPLVASLNFVKKYEKKIDYIIVGFDDLNQFNELLKVYNSKIKIKFKDIRNKDLKLIDPRRWNK